MKTIRFDFSLFTDRRAAHGAMRAALGEYGYEGNNLDALYDALTSMGDAEITLINTKTGRTLIGDYTEKILRTIIDAVENCGCVTLIIK